MPFLISSPEARRQWLLSSPLALLLLTVGSADATAAFVQTQYPRRGNSARLFLPVGNSLSPIFARRERSSARGASSEPLREWFLSELGSLDVPEKGAAADESAALKRTEEELFLDSPAAQLSTELSACTSTRRQWIGSASAAAAAAASAWSFRPETSAAAGTAVAEAPVTVELTVPQLPRSALSLCDPSISTFRNPSTGRIVHILGTAHISTDSAQLAGRVVREVKPDAVFVELDRKRIARALPGEDEAPSGGPGAGEKISVGITARGSGASGPGDFSSVGGGQPDEVAPQQQPSRRGLFGNPIQQAKERVLTASTKAVGDAIKGMYSKLGDQGFNPGEEFILAIKEAMALNAAVVLGDRDVDVTLRRLTEALARTDLKKLLSSDSELEQSLKNVLPEDMRSSMEGDSTKMTKDQLTTYVETVKARENVRAIMSQLKLYAPELYQAMVAERDEYMARGLDSLDKFGTTVAVMGIAHLDGVEGSLREKGWEPVSIPCPAK